jgi:uracil-DNA glycosylase
MQLNKVKKQYLEFCRLSGIQDIYFKEPFFDNQDLNELKEKYKDCTACKLNQGRIKFVYGEGNPEADILLIGEAPGAEENITGKPFVGKAGQLLTQMLQAINLQRDEIYITNTVKCRPPGNRNPQPEEILACSTYLAQQINIINPKLILLLGKVAAQTMLKKDFTLTKFREQTYSINGIKTFVTYHPSALLRNEGWKRPAWEDLKKFRDEYKKVKDL